MIISIIVHVSCDRCGQCFQVNVDEASTGTSAYGMAENGIRGALDYREPDGGSGASSIQNGQQLCDGCTTAGYAMSMLTREGISMPSPPLKKRLHLEASRQWIQEHAATYPGQWIAVRYGVLLGTAATAKALLEQIGPEVATEETIIVRVLNPREQRRPYVPYPTSH